jgi:hypothetical protein
MRRFAYADPPYPGQARKHYGPDAREVNHALLFAHLEEFDGWALSTSSPALRLLLPLAPLEARIAAWVKPFAVFKPGVNPAYAWEPVLFRAPKLSREEETVRDWASVNVSLHSKVHGAKPPLFCYWLFRLLGMKHGDEFHDIFPGSGNVSRAWESFQSQQVLRLVTP